jgi:hypothetical protein
MSKVGQDIVEEIKVHVIDLLFIDATQVDSNDGDCLIECQRTAF